MCHTEWFTINLDGAGDVAAYVTLVSTAITVSNIIYFSRSFKKNQRTLVKKNAQKEWTVIIVMVNMLLFIEFKFRVLLNDTFIIINLTS